MPEAAGVVTRIYGNLGRLLGGKAAAGVISLAYMALAARALGPSDYGVLVLVHTYVMTVGGIIEFPGWHAVVRYGAQALAKGDRGRLTRLLAFCAVVEAVAGAIAVAVAALLAPLLGPRLGWSAEAVAFAAPYSLAVLASIRSTPAGYLQLAGRFDLIGLHGVVAPMVRLAGAGAAMTMHAGLRGFLIAWLVAALAEWASMWALGGLAARRQIAGPLPRGWPRQVVRENAGLGRFMLAANADVTISELAGRLTPLAVGGLLGPSAAGLYAIAQRATSVLAQPAQVLGQAAYAELARLVTAGADGDQLRAALIRTAGVGVLAAVPVCAIILLWGRQIAVLMAGDGFAAAATPMLWLALARAVFVSAPPTTAALTALGRPGLSARANLAANVGLLALLPPMLWVWGLAGAGAYVLLQAVAAVGLLSAWLWRETASDRLLADVRT